MATGYYLSSFVKLTKPQAISISIESGIQNGTMAIAIAIGLLNNTAYAVAPAVYGIIMFITGGFFIYLSGRMIQSVVPKKGAV